MRRILVIEDDEVQAAGAMRILRREGMHCDHSRTFADALTRTTDVGYDCAIFDLGLPDEDIHDSFEAARRIPELGCPVVVWTGCGDPEIMAAVRKTGAAIVLKPGIELLVQMVWSQIQYHNPDRESEMGQMNAQRAIGRKSFIASNAATITLAIAVLSFSGTLGAWLYKSISAEARGDEVMRQQLAILTRRMDAGETRGLEKQAHLTIHDQQIQVSIDDRAAMRAQMTTLVDSQHDLKLDIQRRLERIEDNLLSLLKREKQP